MAQPTDESKMTILPEPELNPLLNPLLAAHMGRWAEVYFTSPPEKRAQAVADLVRELEKSSSSESAYDPVRDSNEPLRREVDEELDQPSFPSVSKTFEHPGVCESCGHKNAPQQKFCGMCGRLRVVSRENTAQAFDPVEQFEEAPPDASTWDESKNVVDSAAQRATESDVGSLPAIDDRPVDYHQESQNLRWTAPYKSPPEFSVLSDYESEASSPSYRIYVGVVVTILLGLLVYMTWRSNTALWSRGTAPSLPAAVEAPKSEPAAEPPAKAPAPLSANDQATPSAAPQTAAPQNQNSGEARRNDAIDRRAAVRPTPRTVSVAASSKTTAAEKNGSEELTTAEKFLHSGPGTARDSREAANWLWKAVAKQNSTATLLLSDLYLRGDGVTKSCDQARLLLDAAARKGETAAGQRLRNLQAFGCR